MLILLHDGSQWHAGIRRANGHWEIRQEKTSGFENLPDSILEWAVNQGALNVRVAVPSELYQFEMNTADLLVLNPAEVYQMLSYELVEKGGCDVDNIAPCVVRSAELEIDSDPNGLIGGALERSMIAGFLDVFRQYGMKLEGVSSLQGLLLSNHKQNRSDSRESILFFGEKESFVCGQPRDEHRGVYRSVPVGYPRANRSEEYDRRIERRIKGYAGNAMNIIAIESVLENCRECIAPIVGDDIRVTPLKEVVPELLLLLAGARRYMLEGSVALTNLPPKVKDDKYTGGVICFWAIFMTALVLGSLFGVKTMQKRSLVKLHDDIRNIEQKQKSAKSSFDKAEGEISSLKNLNSFLGREPEKVDRHFTGILLALSHTLPRYSRLNEVYQTKDRTIISGTTVWSQELSGFSIALQDELNDSGLKVVPKTTTPDEKSNSTLFTLEIL